jgi:hypothetical protein
VVSQHSVQKATAPLAVRRSLGGYFEEAA